MTLSELVQSIKYLFSLVLRISGYTTTVENGNATITTWDTTWDTTNGAQPTTAQLSAALAAVQLQQAQQSQTNLIISAYQNARYATPVSVTIGSSSLSFPTDTDTQTNVMAYIAANVLNQSGSGTYPLLDASNALQQLTYSELVSVAQATQTASLAAFGKKQQLVSEIAAATTVAAVQAIVW